MTFNYNVLGLLLAGTTIMLIQNPVSIVICSPEIPYEPCHGPFKYGNIHDENGKCICPKDYPTRKDLNDDISICCSGHICKCKTFFAYHNVTNYCYEIDMNNYKITVNGTKYCQNETYVPNNGKGCCNTNQIGHKHCICEDKCHVWKSPLYDKCTRPTPPLPQKLNC